MRGLRSIINTKVLTIDSLNISHVDWVKIDTEGTEADVLRGMKKTISRHDLKMLIEFIPENGPVDDLLAELEGWEIVGLDHNILCEKKRRMSIGYCEGCGEPLTEGEMCSYEDLCHSCYERLEIEALEEDEEA